MYRRKTEHVKNCMVNNNNDNNNNNNNKAKKNKSYVSKLPRAFVFWCAFDLEKFKV